MAPPSAEDLSLTPFLIARPLIARLKALTAWLAPHHSPAWRYRALGLLMLALAGTGASLVLVSHPRARALPSAQGLRLVPLPPSPPPALLAAPAPPAQTFEDLTPDQAQRDNASVPFSSLPNPAAKAFKMPTGAANDRARALTCLTMAVYYEAASEGAVGQAAVAQVVLNRVRHPLFPKTVCGVVFQGSELKTGCQFTFTCDGSLGRVPSAAGWSAARKIAERALDGFVLKQVGEATHYHTQWVVPYWRPTLVKETQIGAHIFYRWTGGSGLPSAFSGRYAGFEPPPPPIPNFDAGPTTVLAARDDQAPPVLAQVADLAPSAAAQIGTDLAIDSAAPPRAPDPVAAQPPPPAKPVYFGKPFRQRSHPAPGG